MYMICNISFWDFFVKLICTVFKGIQISDKLNYPPVEWENFSEMKTRKSQVFPTHLYAYIWMDIWLRDHGK